MFRTDPQKDRYTQGEELVRTRPKAIQHIVYTSDFEKSASSGEGAKENYSKEILSEARGEEGARWEEDQDQWRRGKESSEWWHDSAGDSQHQLCSGEPVRALLPELQGRLQGEQVQAFRDDVLFLENRSAAAGEKTLASIEFYNHTGKTSELRVHNLVQKTFQEAGCWIGMPHLHLNQLRHGGASDDLGKRLRDHNAVKDRGDAG
ncbi:Peptide chain release factor 1 [Durusdinium trenchii]|uniref:Peptide chain release factor 1 n=1 Tax=Durusdinium trenchii TaxID=1381693 RepID=A0ABP0JEH0_9DINO